jgi:NitT/TauT family transport system permease protein
MKTASRLALSALGLILFLLLWEAAWRLEWLNAKLIPPPSVIPAVFANEVTTGQWWQSLASSLIHYAYGVAFGTLLGVLFGILVAVSPKFSALVEWTVRLLRPVPPPAWIPFAIVWFGISHSAAAFMIGIGVFWINYFAAISGVRAIDRSLWELARAYGHTGFWDRFWNITLPASAPAILGGVRSGFGQGWILVVVSELFGVQGMGQRMMEAAGLLATDIVVVYMFTIALVYSVTDWLFVFVENRILRWQRTH